ncbi:uncharacterized protein RHO25_000247 [Cercospora beticola]|uniref:Zn(2)-C6 fungal-type domain-containing protein n=2 Tax=Cercospora beticola TaxID=122368 RepID=A0ABZ0N7Z1_CERBT|nr:hypothetical protein RHO25_000247 [Cercospora beticola]CAK1356118.1 unnamed protein product [Cercospora beticola]
MESALQQPPSPDDVDAAASQSIATPDGQLKRKRQPRNSACQACAALKMKCIATPTGRCERCHRMERECIPAVPKARKRRTASNVGESEGIPLGEFAGPSASHSGPPPKFDLPAGNHPEYQADRSNLLSRHDLSHNDSKSFIALFARGLGNSAACEELLRGVDYNFVHKAFTIYAQLTPYFPFVELRPGADIIRMVASRPVLTLAICTVSSGAHLELQDRLTQAFRYALSSKVLLGGERSMDVLTGLLVFLAWYHQYRSQHQFYQQLSLLAGIAADLGLYNRSYLPPEDPSSNLERDRAFVGCYYLCANLSAIGFDRPNPMRWTNHLRACAESAAAAGGMPSDRALVAVLELSCAIDEMEDGLRQATDGRDPISPQVIDGYTRAASQRLKALKREFPSLGGTLGFAASSIHIYQRQLRAGPSPESSMLIQCACSVKEYVDELLARPPATLHQMSSVDWASMLETLVLMSRVFRPLPSAGGWEAGALTSMLQRDLALESVIAHMENAPQADPLAPRHESLLLTFRNLCEAIKRGSAAGGGPAGQRAQLSYFGSGVLEPAFWDNLAGVS